MPKLVLGKALDVGDGPAPQRGAQKVDLVALDVLDDGNLELGEEVEGEFINSITEDRLLDLEVVVSTPMLNKTSRERASTQHTNKTLHFAFLIFLTKFNKYVRSSFKILSICR